jgi:hypothetical protein
MSDYDQDEYEERYSRPERSLSRKSEEKVDLIGYFSNVDGKVTTMINSVFYQMASG